MLANGTALVDLITDRSYDRKISGNLFLLQDDSRWRKLFGILKANILFLFASEDDLKQPSLIILVEDSLIELADDNVTGRQFSFSIKFKTTGRTFYLSALDFKSLGNWISFLTICSMDYISATKQSLQAAMAGTDESMGVTAPIEETAEKTLPSA
ncbi:PH domain-containing protein [Ditylenchus destructor]|nr:PH domain-containing protein [Ditylenchus destructor]